MIELPIWLVVLSGIFHGIGVFLFVLAIAVLVFSIRHMKHQRTTVPGDQPRE